MLYKNSCVLTDTNFVYKQFDCYRHQNPKSRGVSFVYLFKKISNYKFFARNVCTLFFYNIVFVQRLAHLFNITSRSWHHLKYTVSQQYF